MVRARASIWRAFRSNSAKHGKMLKCFSYVGEQNPCERFSNWMPRRGQDTASPTMDLIGVVDNDAPHRRRPAIIDTRADRAEQEGGPRRARAPSRNARKTLVWLLNTLGARWICRRRRRPPPARRGIVSTRRRLQRKRLKRANFKRFD